MYLFYSLRLEVLSCNSSHGMFLGWRVFAEGLLLGGNWEKNSGYGCYLWKSLRLVPLNISPPISFKFKAINVELRYPFTHYTLNSSVSQSV